MESPTGKESGLDREYIGRVHRFLTFLSGVVLVLGALAGAYVFFFGGAHPPRFLFR